MWRIGKQGIKENQGSMGKVFMGILMKLLTTSFQARKEITDGLEVNIR